MLNPQAKHRFGTRLALPTSSSISPSVCLPRKTSCSSSLSSSSINSLKTKTPYSPPEGDGESESRKKFEQARKIYPGTKRKLDVELANFRKQHKNHREILPLLAPAIENQIEYRKALKAAGAFVPAWKHFRTWINQSCWGEEPGQMQAQAERLDSDAVQRHAEKLAKMAMTQKTHLAKA